MIELSPLYSVILLLAVLAGLPHGAFDLHIAKRLGLCASPTQVALWLLKYVSLSAAMIAFWLLSPSLALSLFLLISALHFGRDNFAHQPLAATCLGLIIIGLPLLFAPATVATIFSQLLLSPAQAELLVTVFSALCWAAIVILLGVMLTSKPPQRELIVLLLALLVTAWLAHPLVYFALYFSLSHSPRHLRQQWLQLSHAERRPALLLVSLFTVLPIIAAVLATPLLSGHWSERIITLVFIGLAALTMPHMMLLEQAYRRSRQGS
jgi:Brp/Blh family beta-carotene 15,15'-monooxygenase